VPLFPIIKKLDKVLTVSIFLLSFLLSPQILWAEGQDLETCVIQQVPEDFKNLPSHIDQAVVVRAYENSFLAQLMAWEKKDGQWDIALGPLEAVIGKNGLAPLGEKREGDGRTPSGVYALKRAFGYEPIVETGLIYQQVGEDDLWVDDPESNDYNQWVKEGDTQAKSFERLKREDDLYRYAVVVEYNTDPVVPGNGSAIFLHLWRAADQPTAGCVALRSEDVREIMRWLEVDKNPVMVIDLLSTKQNVKFPKLSTNDFGRFDIEKEKVNKK